ncbi:MAG: diadenylate cyclase CdaA [Lachnospiraceae bacterium]|nr:diadenylate cyclase CdaA [Lachnospiraceae bacterium]
MPSITVIDIVEIAILAFFVYQILLWIKNSKAWFLLKGIIIILVFVMIAVVFEMNTILWIFKSIVSIGITAVVIVFQPELRRALEQLGRKKFLFNWFAFDSSKNAEERFSDKTVNEIVKASFDMGKVKTGALIVIERELSLAEYERTGIEVDALVSSQLLINIFEHNTPLHDGAVIIRGNRIVSATCYLPLSDNMELSKALGTRHRAGVGISEVTDSMTIIVSEETGRVSVANSGKLYVNLEPNELKEMLQKAQDKVSEDKKFKLWKGRLKNHEKVDNK